MPRFLEFRRTSGRNLATVRRPSRRVFAQKAEVAPPVNEGPSDLTKLSKDELRDLAESRGLDTGGTKAELAERLADG